MSSKPALPAAARRKSAGDALLSSPRGDQLSASLKSPRGNNLDGSVNGESFKPTSEDTNVQVVCRVRPFNQREIEMHQASVEGKPEWEQYPLRSVVEFSGGNCTFLDSEKEWQVKEQFQFDSCLWSIPADVQESDNAFATQETLFNEYGELILKQAWKGFNTCFFAYGQTGSGKTHSMMGKFEVGQSIDDPNADPGVIPRLCQKLFEQIDHFKIEAEKHKDHQVQTFKVDVKYMEIYNEMVKDLLFTRSTLSPEMRAKTNPENLKIRSSPATGVFVEHLTSVEVGSWQEMVELIELGNSSRHTAATKMNERSSRSHAVFKVTLSQITTTLPKKQFEKPTEHVRDAFINLVDLAGSERNKKTGATGDRLKEAASINKSLSCLKGVIDALVENSITKGPKKRIPYRDSHLTSILMDSLGGNSKTFMLVCLSPHSDNSDETLQTLKYGSKARQIVTTVTVNENASSRMMLDLEDELERMKGELEKAEADNKNSEAVESLRSQIEEHEAHITTLEDEMNEQQKKLTQLRESKEKEMKSRHAAAFANLHALTQARLKRDEAETVQRGLRKELTELETEKADLDSRQEKAEKELDRLQDLTEEHKMKSTEVEHTIDQWKKKVAKLETYCRDLQKTVDEQNADLKRLKDQKIAKILVARLHAARIRIDGRKRLAEQAKKTEDELRMLSQSANEANAKEQEEYDAIEGELLKEKEQLQKTLQGITADTNKMLAEKESQIKKLEEEVALLKKENQNKTSQNKKRIEQAVADWEKKHAQMVEEMDRQYAEAEEEWNTKYDEDSKAEEREYTRSQKQWAAELKRTKDEWKGKLDRAISDGEQRCKETEAEWKSLFDEKVALNEQLRDRLRNIESVELKNSDTLHRVSTVLSASPKPSVRSSKEYKELYEVMKLFQEEYERHMPSKFTMEQLLHADYTNARCKPVPVMETATAFRSTSPARTTGRASESSAAASNGTTAANSKSSTSNTAEAPPRLRSRTVKK